MRMQICKNPVQFKIQFAKKYLKEIYNAEGSENQESS